MGIYSSTKLVGAFLMVGQRAKRGRHILIPGGPLINWENAELVNEVVLTIKSIAKQYRALFVRMRPELIDTAENRRMVRKLGFVPAPMHLHAENTWVLNVNRPLDQIMSEMRKNTRYLVRKSLQSELELVTDNSAVDTLSLLQAETVERKKFVGFSEKFFAVQMQTFGGDNQAELYVVKKGKINLAAAIIIYYGDYAYYHHSGSSNTMREIPSSYFLQWHVIQEAHKRGLKGYNFWGIAPEGQTNHRFSGVTTFKTGFGGERIDWLHAHDLPISPGYAATFAYETIRKRLRGL